MSEFKIGDRVRVLDKVYGGPENGEGVVTIVDKDGDATVRFDGWTHGHNGDCGDLSDESHWFFIKNEIELIESDDPYLDAATEALLAAPDAGDPDDAWELWYAADPDEYERLIALAAAAIKRASEL